MSSGKTRVKISQGRELIKQNTTARRCIETKGLLKELLLHARFQGSFDDDPPKKKMVYLIPS